MVGGFTQNGKVHLYQILDFCKIYFMDRAVQAFWKIFPNCANRNVIFARSNTNLTMN